MAGNLLEVSHAVARLALPRRSLLRPPPGRRGSRAGDAPPRGARARAADRRRRRPRGGGPRRPAPARQPGPHPGGHAGGLGVALARRPRPRPAPRGAGAAPQPGIHRRRGGGARAGHRGVDGGLLPRPRRAAVTAALPRSGAARHRADPHPRDGGSVPRVPRQSPGARGVVRVPGRLRRRRGGPPDPVDPDECRRAPEPAERAGDGELLRPARRGPGRRPGVPGGRRRRRRARRRDSHPRSSGSTSTPVSSPTSRTGGSRRRPPPWSRAAGPTPVRSSRRCANPCAGSTRCFP